MRNEITVRATYPSHSFIRLNETVLRHTSYTYLTLSSLKSYLFLWHFHAKNSDIQTDFALFQGNLKHSVRHVRIHNLCCQQFSNMGVSSYWSSTQYIDPPPDISVSHMCDSFSSSLLWLAIMVGEVVCLFCSF